MYVNMYVYMYVYIHIYIYIYIYICPLSARPAPSPKPPPSHPLPAIRGKLMVHTQIARSNTQLETRSTKLECMLNAKLSPYSYILVRH